MASISDFSPRVQSALTELVAAIQAETMAAIARVLPRRTAPALVGFMEELARR